MKKLKDFHDLDKPREKLKAKDPAELSDIWLSMAIIGSGNVQANVSKIANDIKKLIRKVRIDQLKFKLKVRA